MQLPNLTHDQIQDRCTAQSFTRGEEYFDIGMIGNPILHGWTLSATCEGTEEYPYHVSVELMPTGIADADCSCPYDWGGDCKHIVALLLTYVDTPEVIYSLDALLTALAEKPKETLLRVISELLKRSPELVPVAKFYADIPEEPEVEIEPIPPELSVYATVVEEVPDVEPASPTHAPTVSATVTLIYALFVYQQSAVAWRTLEKFPLSIDEYTRLLQSPIATSIPGFADKLLARIRDHQPDAAITLYQHLIEQSIHARKREAYEKGLDYLTALRGVYQNLGQEDQWTVYLEDLRKRHTRKRLLLQIISEI